MSITSIILIALGLAMDAFAVSITIGITIKRARIWHALLVGIAFGVFQALMPVLGWSLGRWAWRFIGALDYWLAFGMLVFVGGHMIIQALQPEETGSPRDPLHLPSLLTLAVATSIDAFAIGITLSMLRVSILSPVLVIGLVTFALSFAGVYCGRFLGHFNERKMEVAGGLVLMGLGLKILIQNLIAKGGLFENEHTVWFALAITLAAGLATGVGSLLAFLRRESNSQRLSFFLGVSTGLLLWIAFRQMLPIAEAELNHRGIVLLAFFGGFLLGVLVDRLVPEFGNPHESRRIEDLMPQPEFRRTGMPAITAMGLHSVPEGLAVFVAALVAPVPVAIGAAVALALHNIPEGVATAFPMYHATGSRAKACGFSSLTGLAEPLAALLVYTVFHRFMSGAALGILCAGGGGVMVFIAIDGLLPLTRLYGKYHESLYGVVMGMLAAAALSGL